MSDQQIQILSQFNNPTPERIALAAASQFANEHGGDESLREVKFMTSEGWKPVIVRKFEHESGSYGMLWLKLEDAEGNPFEGFYRYRGNYGDGNCGYMRPPQS